MGAIETRLEDFANRLKRLTRDVVSGVEEVMDGTPKEFVDQVFVEVKKKTKKGKELKKNLFERMLFWIKH